MSGNSGARHIGVVGVSVEGALLCVREIRAHSEGAVPHGQGPQVSMHAHPFSAYSSALNGGHWSRVRDLLVDSIERLARAGAELAIIPANAVHAVIGEVQQRSPLPVVDLLKEASRACAAKGVTRAGVLGAKWSMRSGLYTGPMRSEGIEAVVPTDQEQEEVHAIITQELFFNRVERASVERLVAIVAGLRGRGCGAVVLACTELPLALSEQNCGVPAIDTTRLLASRAVEQSLRP